MIHVVLLGDSIFDNAAYVGGGPDVVRQLQGVLPAGCQATLSARDGARVRDVYGQLDRLPPAPTHLVISAGGNDALAEMIVLEERARSVAESLRRLADVRDAFTVRYRNMLDTVLRLRVPTAVCTIYEAPLPDRQLRRVANTALTAFNDAITRAAFNRGATVIDLRSICCHDEDFATSIEPSVRGGDKIAQAVLRFVQGTGSRANVIVGPHTA